MIVVRPDRTPLFAAVVGVQAAVVALSVEVASAQAAGEAEAARPGTLALLFGSLMLVTWLVAFSISIHRARGNRLRPPEATGPRPERGTTHHEGSCGE